MLTHNYRLSATLGVSLAGYYRAFYECSECRGKSSRLDQFQKTPA
nr:MAG TPA: hypothetical protein [Caudoviricetes sp.]